MLDSGLAVAFAFGPTGVACLVGIVIAVTKWRAEPVVARLGLVGLSILLVSSIVTVFGARGIVDITGWTVDEVRSFYTGIGIVVLVLNTMAWVLLLTALFVRLPQRATAPAGSTETAEDDGAPTGRHVLLDDAGQPVVAETGQFLAQPRTAPGFPAVGAGAAGVGVAGAAFGTGVFAEPRSGDGPPGDVVSPEATPDAGEESPTQALPLLGDSGRADEGAAEQADEASVGHVATGAGEPAGSEEAGAETAGSETAGSETADSETADSEAADSEGAGTPEADADEPAFDARALDDDAFDAYGIPRDRPTGTSTPPDGTAAPTATSSSDRSPAVADDGAVEPTAAPTATPGSPSGQDTETRAFPVASPEVDPDPEPGGVVEASGAPGAAARGDTDDDVSATPATTDPPEPGDDPDADEDHGPGDDPSAAEPEVADQPSPTAATPADPDPDPDPEPDAEGATVSEGADVTPTADPEPATERPTTTGVAGPLPVPSPDQPVPRPAPGHHPWFTPTGVDDPSSGASSGDEDTADADERSTRTGG